MASILQGVDSVFETDLFRHLIDAAASALGHGPDAQNAASFRVIADHLRSVLVPRSPTACCPRTRGAAMCCAASCAAPCATRSCSGASEPLMWKLVPTLTREMGQAYPELLRAEALITETLKLEETRFRKTLERGLSILDERDRRPEAGRQARRARPRSRSTTPTASRSISRRTRCKRARHRRRHRRRSPPRWSSRRRRRAPRGPARARPRPRRSGSRCARSSARPSSSATTPRPPKASSPRWCATARRSPN